jgi:hypothetical protein
MNAHIFLLTNWNRSFIQDEYLIKIGMKDAGDPDDGSERKRDIWLTADWLTYEFNLASDFDCQINRVYVVTEFVFPCPGQNIDQTIEVRTIGFRE